MPESSNNLPARLIADVSPTLEWLHKRAWPIGGIGLVATLVCLLHYARQERVPLDLTSPSLIAAVPALFALIGFASALLALTFLTPAWLLSWSLHPGDPPLGDSLQPPITCPDRDKADATRLRLVLCWFGTPIAQATVLLGMGSLTEAWPASLSTMASMLTAVLSGAIIMLLSSPPLRLRSMNAWGNASAIAFGHLVCALTLLLIFLQQARDWPTAFATVTATLGGLSVVQLGAWRFAQRLLSRPHPLGEAAAAAILLLLFVAIAIPPAGSALASFALRAPLTGGAACVEMTWVPDRAPEGVDRWLRVVAPAGDTLLVQRPGTPDTTYFLRRDAILAMTGIDCRVAEQRANDERAQTAHAR